MSKYIFFVGMQDNYIAGIFVDKTFRFSGIGKNLFEYVKAIYPSFSLNVYQENNRSVKFYLHEGLIIVSEGLENQPVKVEYIMSKNANECKSDFSATETMIIREYNSADSEEIANLFYDTVNVVNVKDYS